MMFLSNIVSTPIYKLDEKLNDNNFYIKREDLLPISFGGNKARKAVLFFKDIKLKGADCIVTYGSSSSNHCRIISNLAAVKKLPCYIIYPKDNSKKTTNRKMIELFGARVIQCSVSEVRNVIEKTLIELRNQGY